MALFLIMQCADVFVKILCFYRVKLSLSPGKGGWYCNARCKLLSFPSLALVLSITDVKALLNTTDLIRLEKFVEAKAAIADLQPVAFPNSAILIQLLLRVMKSALLCQ